MPVIGPKGGTDYTLPDQTLGANSVTGLTGREWVDVDSADPRLPGQGASVDVIGATLPTRDLREFLVVGDGVADDTTALQAAFDFISGGGKLTCPRHLTVNISSTITVTRDTLSTPIAVDFNGALFQWTGAAAPMFQFDGGGSHATQIGPNIREMRLDGGSTATAGFHWTDSGTSQWHDVRVDNVAGPAWHLRNFNSFSENMTFKDIVGRQCHSIAQYDGPTETGGTGQSSFARQHWDTVRGTDLSVAWFVISQSALPYDSEWYHIKGNMGMANAVPVFDVDTGIGAGTVIRGLKVEQGPVGAFLFDSHNNNGSGPVLTDYVLRNDIGLIADGDTTWFANSDIPGRTLTAGVTMPAGGTISVGSRDRLITAEMALVNGVAQAIPGAASAGALTIEYFGNGLPTGVVAAAKRGAFSAASLSTLVSVNGSGAETITVAWPNSSAPTLTSSADMTVIVSVFGA